MKSYHTYIFDLDGTITDTTRVWLQIFRDCLAIAGVDASQLADKEIARYTHDWVETTNLGVKPEDIPAFAEHAYELANRYLPDASQFPGAYKTLQALKAKGKKVGIFSNMDRIIFEPAMEHNKLYDVTDTAVAGGDVPNRKPQPDGILKALDDLGVPPEKFDGVMYMGDKDTDIQAAHNAGVDAILFFPPSHQAIYDAAAVQQHKPVATIASWQEVLDSLQG